MFACCSLVPDKSLEGCGVQGVGVLAITEFLDRAGVRSLAFRPLSCHQTPYLDVPGHVLLDGQEGG